MCPTLFVLVHHLNFGKLWFTSSVSAQSVERVTSKREVAGSIPGAGPILRAHLFEGRLALDPGFSFLCSKAFSRIIFSVIFRASNHQLVDKKN